MWWAGPMATTALADLGAEVIKVEAVQRLDGWRGALAGHTGSQRTYETSPVFNALNRNKLGLTLNLNSREGATIFRRLVTMSDVVCENYSARVMGQFGLDYPSLRKLQPDIVMVSLSGFGRTGPCRDYVAFAATAEASSGIVALTGYPGGPPLMSGTILGDPVPGMFCALATASALEYRRRTGRGQWVDVSQVEAATWGITDALLEYQLTGRLPGRRGNRHPSLAPHDVYRCKGDDEWVAIAIATDEEWKRLCQVLARADLEANSRYASARARRRNEAALRVPIEEWTRQHDKFEAARILQEVGIAAGAVQNPADLLHDPHLEHRGYFQTLERREVGTHPYPAPVPSFADVPRQIRLPAPCLGEHRQWVLGDLLGLSSEYLADLEREHTTGTSPLTAPPLR
ncbi:MAG: CoA transferase [Chloroflexi bacterium]|nr:CoA transferase [Chloroflexota bacterium]